MIPKVVHVSWKDRGLLESESVFVKNCIGKVAELSPNWKVEVSDDCDIDDYLKRHLDAIDYKLLEPKHVVEKCDVWRLIKLYTEGGIYVDIDRLCNTSLDVVVGSSAKMVLPYNDHDFSQDFMCSAPGNPVFMETLLLNLSRRRGGHSNVYFLGPQTYFHAVTKCLTGNIVEVNPGKETIDLLVELVRSYGFISTYKETSVYDTVLYRPSGDQVKFDHEDEKRKFYALSKLKHWTGDW